jgi:hypothetical protein
MLPGRTLNDVGQKSASRSGPQVGIWDISEVWRRLTDSQPNSRSASGAERRIGTDWHCPAIRTAVRAVDSGNIENPTFRNRSQLLPTPLRLRLESRSL